jgi:hypothetical protein
MVDDGQAEQVRTNAPLKAFEFVETFDETAEFILKDFHICCEVIRRIRGVNSSVQISTSTPPSTMAAATT